MQNEVTDANGRRLAMKSLGVGERLRLFRLIPSDCQLSPLWMTYALAACSVRSIDGIPCPMPQKFEDIEARVMQLDDAGIDAAQQFLADATKEKVDAAKNSQGTPASENVSTS
jgi:hypothetical protein